LSLIAGARLRAQASRCSFIHRREAWRHLRP